MIDLYSKFEREVNVLKKSLKNAIEITLKEKGYSMKNAPERVDVPFSGNHFDIEFDRILHNNNHLDRYDVEQLLNVLRDACHVIKK